MKGKRKVTGISLVALVVTIIVLIILTGAVIVTFMDGGIIDRAKESVFKNDIRSYQEQLVILKSKDQINVTVDKKDSELEGKKEELADIRTLLPEFKKEYEYIVAIENGEIVLGENIYDKENEKYSKWLSDLGIGKTMEEVAQEYASILNISDTGVVSGFKEGETAVELIIPSQSIVNGQTITITSIGKSAFEKNKDLKSLVLPNTIQTIGDSAFFMSKLRNIELQEGLKEIAYSAFYMSPLLEITLPEGLLTIGELAFYECNYLKEITIPNSVTTLGRGAFWHCDNLESIVLSNQIESLGLYTFRDCINLKSITIPSSVTSIDSQAFMNNDSLETLIIGVDSTFEVEDAYTWGIPEETTVTKETK